MKWVDGSSTRPDLLGGTTENLRKFQS